MKKQKVLLLLALSWLPGILCLAEGSEQWGWYRFENIRDGEVSNRGKGHGTLWLEGAYRKNADGTISMNGRNTGGKIYNSGSLNFEKGLTLTVVFRTRNLPGDSESGRKHDAWFYKSRRFVFSRRGRMFYINFHNGEKWLDGVRSGELFSVNDNAFHHAAVTIDPCHKPEQGEKWTDVRVYLDGVAVAFRRFHEFLPLPGDDLWEIACASSFGEVWRFGGDLDEVKIFDRVLGSPEIRKEVLASKRVKPGFRTPEKLSGRLRERVESLLVNDPASASALRLTGERGIPAESAEILPLRAGDTTLTLVTAGSRTLVASWFDHAAQRELLNWDNPFFRLHFEGKEFFPEKSELLLPPVRKEGLWHFILRTSNGRQTVDMDVEFDGKHLSYALKCGEKVSSAVFPALRLARMTRGNDILLVPNMSGVELRRASEGGVSYSQPYPCAYGSMQFGAVYDDAGGVLFSAGDPQARRKQMNFSAGYDGSAIEFDWSGAGGRLLPDARAHLELFRGGWLEAARCYRQLQEKIKAPWIMERPESPEWFRNNHLWITADCSNNSSVWLVDLAIRRYLEQGFILHGYHYGAKFDRDYPYLSPTPRLVERRNFLRMHDIRLVPYGNGRLWEKLDRRDEDFTYTKLGLPNSVKERSGRSFTEHYNGAVFSVICPETPIFKSFMRTLAVRMAALGLDGIYFDQIGAGRPVLCYDSSHPHAAGDDTSWFRGQNKTFRTIRAVYRKNYPDALLVTEDNAETCAGNFDGGLAWRWMNEGQVPLYPAVYAGRIQMFGLYYYGTEDYPAACYKAAWQFVSGMQLGWFGEGYFIRPERTSFRRWIKKLIHLRSALKPFIVDGEFAPPVRTGLPLKKKKIYWGPHGDKYLSSPELSIGHWKNGNDRVIVLLNPTENRVRHTLLLEMKCRGWQFREDGNRLSPFYGTESAWEIAPRSVGVLLLSDNREYRDALSRAFGVIRRTAEENDPFTTPRAAMTDRKPQWLPPESDHFVIDEPESGLLRINTGKFSCVFFPGLLYPVWFQHAGTAFTSWRGEGVASLNDPVYRAEHDLRAERRVRALSEQEISVETTGYLCSADDREPVPRRPVVLHYRFQKEADHFVISGTVSGTEHFEKMVVPVRQP